MIGKRIFVEHRFGMGLNIVLDWFEICGFLKARIFDDRGYFCYRTDADVLDGFDAFPMWGTSLIMLSFAVICKDGRNV